MPKKKRDRIVAAGAALGLLLLPLRPAQSGIMSRLGHSIRGLWYQRDEKRDAAQEAYERAGALKHEGVALHDQLEDTQRLLLQANDVYQDYYSQLMHTETEIQGTRRRIAIATAHYDDHRKLFGSRLAAIQRTGKLGYLEMLLGTHTLSDLTRRIYLLNALTTRDAQLQTTLQADREELIAARNVFDSQWQERNRLAEASNRERMRIAIAQSRQEQLLNQIDTSREASLAYAAAQERSSDDIAAMINRLTAHREELAQQYDATQHSSPAPAISPRSENHERFAMQPGELKPMPIRDIIYQDKMEPRGSGQGQLNERYTEEAGLPAPALGVDNSWSLPLRGRLSSRYGMRFHPILHRYKLHTGDDLAAGEGTPFHAAHGGRVLWAGWKTAYGNTLIIDQGNGITVLYGHASKLAVRAGQPIRRGDYIGNVGSTGWSTGPHLHFEVRKDGHPIDPTSYLTGH